jgi:hypothetical protein
MSWRSDNFAFISPQKAHAQQVAGQYLTLDRDSFIITSSNDGDKVYVYYFNRKPVKEETTIQYITMATAKK